MKKLNKKELEEITLQLKPYWVEYENLLIEHSQKVRELEDKMNKEIKPKTKLEFFYCDGECVGIGAENYSDREFFPLIGDSKLSS